MSTKDLNDIENDIDAPPSSNEPGAAPAPEPAAPEPQTPPTPESQAPSAESRPSGQPPAESRPSASQGEPLFDWSPYKGKTEVPHPNAEKGLMSITRDSVYHYRVEEHKPNGGMSFQVGTFNPTNLKNPTAATNATFADNYMDTGAAPQFLVTREWRLLHGALGILSARVGSGAYVAQGHGHFADPNVTAKYGLPKEVFTFLALPNSVGAIYRFQWHDRQLFVPYAEGGGIAYTFAELRDDGLAPKFGGALAAYGAGGLAMDMTHFDYFSRAELNREYGITTIYLTAEYRQVIGLSRYDFTASYPNAGFFMEY